MGSEKERQLSGKRGSRGVGHSLTVLQVLPALEVGGVERGTVEVAGELVRRGHQALVMSMGGALMVDLIRTGARHYTWSIGKKSPITLLLVRKLRGFLKREQVDVLHARSRLPAWVAYLAWKKMPVEARPVFITSAHGPYSVNRYSEIMTRGQNVIAVSEFIQDYILENYAGVDPRKISVIPRGVDAGRFPRGYTPTQTWLYQWQGTCPQLQGKALITLPGRVTRWKGHTDFIDIIALLKQEGSDIHGLVAGGAHPDRQGFLRELKRMVANKGLDNDVTFLGQRDDLREVLSISAIVLSLANEPEAFGRTVLEALSLGRPVIAYGHGGVREVLNELQPDGLVAPGDIRAAVRKIQTFLISPPLIAANRHYTLEQMLSKTLALYEQAHIINEKSV